jgi:S1-C subfamily serine protease
MRSISQSCGRSTLPLLVLFAVLIAPSPIRAQELTEARRTRIARRLAISTVTVETGHGEGSGFVVGVERWIVTNFHVVDSIVMGRVPGTATTSVTFGSGTTLRARVIETDPDHDLALLELEGGHVPAPPLELADSDGVTVGQTVLAFGSPYGLDGTLTQGIVSARRELALRHGPLARRLIQMDAEIGPGSSGGPLVDRLGRVVGVNTASYGEGGGIHLAVPSNYVRDLLERVRAARAAPPVVLQATTPNVDIAIAAAAVRATSATAGLVAVDSADAPLGVLVLHVLPGSPAQRAGILGAEDPPPPRVALERLAWSGHVIIAADGHATTTLAELDAYLASVAPGQSVRLTVRMGVAPSAPTGDTVMITAASP